MQRKVWLHAEHGKSRFKVKRRFAIVVTFVTVLAFIYFITSERDFFDVRAKNVSVLGEHSDPSNSHVARPKQSVQNAKGKPIVLLKYHLNHENRTLKVDSDGYILEFIDSPQDTDASVTIVADKQQKLPEPGTQVISDGVQLGLRVLRFARSSTPEIASKLRTIDANQPEKIILQLDDDLPVVWLSSDLIETGLNNIEIFLKNQTTIVKQKKRNRKKAYLDARFEEAIYLGRIN